MDAAFERWAGGVLLTCCEYWGLKWSAFVVYFGQAVGASEMLWCGGIVYCLKTVGIARFVPVDFCWGIWGFRSLIACGSAACLASWALRSVEGLFQQSSTMQQRLLFAALCCTMCGTAHCWSRSDSQSGPCVLRRVLRARIWQVCVLQSAVGYIAWGLAYPCSLGQGVRDCSHAMRWSYEAELCACASGESIQACMSACILLVPALFVCRGFHMQEWILNWRS